MYVENFDVKYLEQIFIWSHELWCHVYRVCCQCGTPIEANPANTCVACLRTVVDITEGIPKQGTLYFCKGCERYEHR